MPGAGGGGTPPQRTTTLEEDLMRCVLTTCLGADDASYMISGEYNTVRAMGFTRLVHLNRLTKAQYEAFNPKPVLVGGQEFKFP